MNFDCCKQAVSDEQGSTVIEIVVAFAIVSIALIQGFDLIASSARSGAALAEKTSALAIAENQIALLRTAGTPQAARTSGQAEDGFAYSVSVAPVQGAATPGGAATSQAFRVTVRVNRDGREVVSLESWALFPFDRR